MLLQRPHSSQRVVGIPAVSLGRGSDAGVSSSIDFDTRRRHRAPASASSQLHHLSKQSSLSHPHSRAPSAPRRLASVHSSGALSAQSSPGHLGPAGAKEGQEEEEEEEGATGVLSSKVSPTSSLSGLDALVSGPQAVGMLDGQGGEFLLNTQQTTASERLANGASTGAAVSDLYVSGRADSATAAAAAGPARSGQAGATLQPEGGAATTAAAAAAQLPRLMLADAQQLRSSDETVSSFTATPEPSPLSPLRQPPSPLPMSSLGTMGAAGTPPRTPDTRAAANTGQQGAHADGAGSTQAALFNAAGSDGVGGGSIGPRSTRDSSLAGWVGDGSGTIPSPPPLLPSASPAVRFGGSSNGSSAGSPTPGGLHHISEAPSLEAALQASASLRVSGGSQPGQQQLTSATHFPTGPAVCAEPSLALLASYRTHGPGAPVMRRSHSLGGALPPVEFFPSPSFGMPPHNAAATATSATTAAAGTAAAGASALSPNSSPPELQIRLPLLSGADGHAGSGVEVQRYGRGVTGYGGSPSTTQGGTSQGGGSSPGVESIVDSAHSREVAQGTPRAAAPPSPFSVGASSFSTPSPGPGAGASSAFTPFREGASPSYRGAAGTSPGTSVHYSLTMPAAGAGVGSSGQGAGVDAAHVAALEAEIQALRAKLAQLQTQQQGATAVGPAPGPPDPAAPVAVAQPFALPALPAAPQQVQPAPGLTAFAGPTAVGLLALPQDLAGAMAAGYPGLSSSLPQMHSMQLPAHMEAVPEMPESPGDEELQGDAAVLLSGRTTPGLSDQGTTRGEGEGEGEGEADGDLPSTPGHAPLVQHQHPFAAAVTASPAGGPADSNGSAASSVAGVVQAAGPAMLRTKAASILEAKRHRRAQSVDVGRRECSHVWLGMNQMNWLCGSVVCQLFEGCLRDSGGRPAWLLSTAAPTAWLVECGHSDQRMVPYGPQLPSWCHG